MKSNGFFSWYNGSLQIGCSLQDCETSFGTCVHFSICMSFEVALMTDLMYRMSKYWIESAYRKLVSYLCVKLAPN